MTDSICAHHPRCAGCPLLDLSYAESASKKHHDLQMMLHEARLFDGTVERVDAQRTLAWRARARMVLDPDASSPETLLGFYAAGSRELLPIPSCPAHRAPLEAALGALRPLLFEEEALRRATAFVEGRCLDDTHVHLTLCLRGEHDLDALKEATSRVSQALAKDVASPEERTLSLRVGGRGHAIGSGESLGDETQTHQLGNGRTLDVPAESFFQQHPDQLERAHQTLRGWLGEPPQRVIDLYCGVGVHGLALVAEGGELVGLDVDEGAIEAARENTSKHEDLRSNFAALSDQEADAWLDANAPEQATVVVNPARAGLHWRTIAWLARRRPEQLVYMSCDRESLRRDLIRLQRCGLRVTHAAMLDMMPFTAHHESLVLLTAGAPPEAPCESWQGAFPYGADSATTRQLSDGISGVSLQGTSSTWEAVLAGRAPRQGALPRDTESATQIQCERIDEDGHVSRVILHVSGEIDDLTLRRRLRAWGHPVVGDAKFGDKKINRYNQLHLQLDRMLLHCSSVTTADGETQHAALDADWPSRIF